jgi:hypothetical protein
MTRQVIPENTVQQAINTVVQNNYPYPPENNEYRFYHCHLDWNGLKCKKVNGPQTMPTRDNSVLLFVKSYIPERFDKHILKYQWIPDKVIIEENQLKTN